MSGDWVVRATFKGYDKAWWLRFDDMGSGCALEGATRLTYEQACSEMATRAVGTLDATYAVVRASEAPSLNDRSYEEVQAIWERRRAERAVVADARKRMDDAIDAYVQVLAAHNA